MTAGLRVHRSLLRTLLVLLAGVVLILAAIDVLTVHVVSASPETDASTGALTSRGQNQQRSDLAWGWGLLVAGGAIVLVSTASLLSRQPVLEIGDAALRLRIAGPRRFIDVPWDDIAWVHSAADGDDEVVPPRVLLVHLRPTAAHPDSLWGARWDGSTLAVDADSWNRRPEDVATHIDVALDAWRRAHGPAPADEEG